MHHNQISHHDDYGSRLMELRLPSHYRRQHGDIPLYQIFNSLVDIDANEVFTQSSRITRGHELKFASVVLVVCQ